MCGARPREHPADRRGGVHDEWPAGRPLSAGDPGRHRQGLARRGVPHPRRRSASSPLADLIHLRYVSVILWGRATCPFGGTRPALTPRRLRGSWCLQQPVMLDVRIGGVHPDVMVLLPIVAGVIGGPSPGRDHRLRHRSGGRPVCHAVRAVRPGRVPLSGSASDSPPSPSTAPALSLAPVAALGGGCRCTRSPRGLGRARPAPGCSSSPWSGSSSWCRSPTPSSPWPAMKAHGLGHDPVLDEGCGPPRIVGGSGDGAVDATAFRRGARIGILGVREPLPAPPFRRKEASSDRRRAPSRPAPSPASRSMRQSRSRSSRSSTRLTPPSPAPVCGSVIVGIAVVGLFDRARPAPVGAPGPPGAGRRPGGGGQSDPPRCRSTPPGA